MPLDVFVPIFTSCDAENDDEREDDKPRGDGTEETEELEDSDESEETSTVRIEIQ